MIGDRFEYSGHQYLVVAETIWKTNVGSWLRSEVAAQFPDGNTQFPLDERTKFSTRVFITVTFKPEGFTLVPRKLCSVSPSDS